MGIRGNEKADRAAKSALSQDILPFKVPSSDFKHLVNIFTRDVWQNSWADPNNRNNKLFKIKPVLGDWLPGSRSSRREEIVLARLRIGHTYITHNHVLKGEEAPQCVPCFAPLSVHHIFVECVDVAAIRDTYFHVSSLKELFDTVLPETIFAFLKEINLYFKV